MSSDKDFPSHDYLKKEVERYKSLYEHEKEQFEEFQRYSKELEAELEAELSGTLKKLKDVECLNVRFSDDIQSLRERYQNERNEFFSTENSLKLRLSAVEEECRGLRERLRAEEQKNDDLERRERIQAQEIVDLQARYDQCLERCALLEAGLVEPSMIEVADEINRRYQMNLASPSSPTANNTSLTYLSNVPIHLNSSSSIGHHYPSDIVMSDSSLVSSSFTSSTNSGGPNNEFNGGNSDGSTSSGIGTARGSELDDCVHTHFLSSAEVVHQQHQSTPKNNSFQGNPNINGHCTNKINQNGCYYSAPAKGHGPRVHPHHQQQNHSQRSSSSSQIVSHLIRKIEEAQKHLDPRKFTIRRTPRAKEQQQ